MPKATEENVLKELTETFDLLESKGKELIQKYYRFIDLSEDENNVPGNLADYIVAADMMELEYGNNSIPTSHLNMKGSDR